VSDLTLTARRVWRIGVEVLRKYEEDGGPLVAAAISFFGILSIIPLALMGVWGLGQFVSSEEAFRDVLDFMKHYLPGSAKLIRHYLEELIASRGTIGWLGIAGLLWSGSQGFVTLELAINHALRVPNRRNFLESRLLGFWMILLTGSSLALSLVITSTIATIRRFSLPVLDWSPDEIPLLWTTIGATVPVLLAILSFSVIYRVMPNMRMPWRTALIAGTVAGLLWEFAKRGFTYYLARYATYDAVYGSIGGIIGLVFWIYYSSVILVLGTELASVLQDVHPHQGEHPSRQRRHQIREK
jgi:membrane protein